MISRLWHGWTSRENAGAYEDLLRREILPGIHRVKRYRGAFLLRKDAGDEIEFVTLTMFDSMDAVRAFAGDNYAVAVVPAEARKLLSRFDARSEHYETFCDWSEWQFAIFDFPFDDWTAQLAPIGVRRRASSTAVV